LADRNRGRLFVISGPSGAGKSSVVKGLRQRRHFYFSVSATTRDPRPAEEHGVHYWFVAPEEFGKLIEARELLEWAEYNDRRYGTLRTPVLENLEQGTDVLLEIEVQGARQIRESYPGAIMFFVVPPSIEDLEARLRLRADTPDDEIARRLLIARGEIADAKGVFDFVVVNADLERCIAEVDQLMSAVE
jgi:guanylate kinase